MHATIARASRGADAITSAHSFAVRACDNGWHFFCSRRGSARLVSRQSDDEGRHACLRQCFGWRLCEPSDDRHTRPRDMGSKCEVRRIEDDARRGIGEARGPVDAAEAEEDKVQLVRTEEHRVVATAEALQRGHPEHKARCPRDQPGEVVDVRATAAMFTTAEPIGELVTERLHAATEPVDQICGTGLEAASMSKQQGGHGSI